MVGGSPAAHRHRRSQSFTGGFLMACLASGVFVNSGAAQIAGRVVDEDSNGIPAAAVRVLSDDSLGVRVLTDSAGSFLIPAAPLGEIRLEVTAFGFGGATEVLTYDGNRTFIELRIARDPVELDGLSIHVERRNPYLERTGFYRRSRTGLGYALDFESDPPRPVYRTGQLLQRVPGIVVRNGEPIVPRHQGVEPCLPLVLVDNILVRGGARGDGLRFEDVAPPPSMIAAVEIYKSGAFAPAQWRSSGSGCGVIAIWTKR